MAPFILTEEVVFHVLGVVLDYLSLAIIIAFFYVLFNLFSGGKGIGSLFNRTPASSSDPDDGSRRTGGAPPRTTPEPDAPGIEGDPNPEGGRPKGLDYTQPVHVRVLVTNADDNPIPKAQVRIFALDKPMLQRALGISTAERPIHGGMTGPDGCYPSRPSYLVLGTGPIRIKVKTPFGDAREDHWVYRPEDGSVVEFQIGIARRGSRGDAAEPHIEDVKATDDGYLRMTGVVR